MNELISKAQEYTPEQKTRGRKPVLTPDIIEAIRYMRAQKHMSFKQIHAFLCENGHKHSYITILNSLKTAKKHGM